MASVLEHGLRALFVVNARGSASPREICEVVGMSQRDAKRILSELLRLGYVAVDETTGRYTQTGRGLQLGGGYRLPTRLAQVAGPTLSEFGAQIGWPSHLAVFDQDAMTVVLATGGFSVSAENRGVGTRGPMLLSSNGRAYLGFCSTAERAQILERLRASDSPLDALARDIAKVNRLLQGVRRQGYATSDPAYVRRVYGGLLHGISVPVHLDTRVVGAVNVMFLRQALNRRAGVAALLQPLQTAADRISSDLTRDLGWPAVAGR